MQAQGVCVGLGRWNKGSISYKTTEISLSWSDKVLCSDCGPQLKGCQYKQTHNYITWQKMVGLIPA